jgi:outer membrane protein assembly factor BamB
MSRVATGIVVSALLLLAGCGGGGSSGSAASNSPASPPYVTGTFVGFATAGVPSGYLPAGTNSLAAVSVLDKAGGTSIGTATVSINGVALTYSASYQTYGGVLSVNPGTAVSLTVSVGGATYMAAGTQAPSYPTVTAPQSGAQWSLNAPNVVSWSGALPGANWSYALGVLDSSTGQLIWPSSNAFLLLPGATTSETIPASSLTAGNRLAWVGAANFVSMPNAVSGSGFYINGFTSVPISIANTPVVTLTSIAVTPAGPTAVAVGGTLQLTATGRYSDSTTSDLTTQVMWTSSDTTKVSVNATGAVTGVAYGSATVTASLGGISGSATVNVFQPNPSPVPPLSQAVAYQIDYAHSGYAVFNTAVTFPSTPAWTTTFNGSVGYPLIAGGQVFVITGAPGGTQGSAFLYALNESTGAINWGPITIAGTYNWGAHAYDHGMIFVINFDGLLRSFSAATGAPAWSTQLPNQYAFSSPPTAVNGVVYVGGAGIGGTLYAVDESNGNLLWTASVMNGDDSSPAVSSDGVFVSYPCQVYKFDPYSGSPLWHYNGPCEGGGGRTAAFANGLLYARDWSTPAPYNIYDGATGNIVGTFTSTPIPALSAQGGYFLSAGTLTAIDLASKVVSWTFAGDGQLVSAPIVINNTVIVGSGTGMVYALDAATGAQVWSSNAGAAIPAPDETNLFQLTGFGAGEGYLVVPAGSVLTAWHLSP